MRARCRASWPPTRWCLPSVRQRLPHATGSSPRPPWAASLGLRGGTDAMLKRIQSTFTAFFATVVTYTGDILLICVIRSKISGLTIRSHPLRRGVSSPILRPTARTLQRRKIQTGSPLPSMSVSGPGCCIGCKPHLATIAGCSMKIGFRPR